LMTVAIFGQERIAAPLEVFQHETFSDTR
jgi:hypothetical protein